jgi:urease accessory protein
MSQPTVAPAPHAVRGWEARLVLRIAARIDRSVLIAREHSGPLVVQRPFYPEGAPCHLYLLHPPGGVVGGDRLHLEVDVQAGAHALITAPGAAKFYRSSGALAQQTQCLAVAADAALEWLPHENIFFPGAHTRLETRIDLAEGARFIGWELQCFGRPALPERFHSGRAEIATRLSRNGRPLIAERLRIRDGVGLDGPTGLRGFPVCASLMASGATAETLALVRERVGTDRPFPIAATLVEDLLLVRALAPQTELVTRLFRDLWSSLRPILLGRSASAPRIWAT